MYEDGSTSSKHKEVALCQQERNIQKSNSQSKELENETRTTYIIISLFLRYII